MSFARRERAALCDLLLELGPDAPTLCEGWTAADLAAHLWLRESDPVAAPGIVVKQFAHVTARRMDAAKRKLPYAELVDRVRRGPGHFSLFALPGLDESANAIEFFVHHEDLRRAQAGEVGPRELSAEDEDMCWKRLGLMGRALFRRSEVALVAERAGTDERLMLRSGEPTVTLSGRPGELILLAYGRRDHAQVEATGPDEAVAAFEQVRLGV